MSQHRAQGQPSLFAASEAWCGWYRAAPYGHWQSVVTGSTERECWYRLLRYPHGPEQRSERMIKPSGKHPNENRR